jgi:aminoglycoside/choline kinase family phosphotransferase
LNQPLTILPPGLEKLVDDYLAAGPGSGGYTVTALTPDGSDRRYFRIRPQTGSPFIAVDGRGTGPGSRFVAASGISQNQTFLYLRDHLAGLGFPVPACLGRDEKLDFYLLEDLGDTTLCDVVAAGKKGLRKEAVPLYHQALTLLVRFQTEAAPGFDPARAYAGGYYDARVVRELELDYFYTAYVCNWAGMKLSPAAEKRLQAEFDRLAAALLKAPADFLLYRDYQSRNLMVREGRLFLIDFQGARRGPIYYDLAALVEDPYVELPRPLRKELVDFYYRRLCEKVGPRAPSRAGFDHFYALFTLVRTLQALGAFGNLAGRGKVHFAASIPAALRNLENVLARLEPDFPLPELTHLAASLAGAASAC